ncbi:hypothetical protein D8674_025590 [Pyrus ussuriensis x Pyrus communis]|uniref:Uncharacterized protein n=1 Tax=Pyrus ussuriensis x Pyrus communis TaxID=2448454 RepID=A0A5N5I4H6_9ROSA|nr:hypothetical protein D8674_025590 [Pyrus ussuriensis x Pyrus communis]
MNDCLKVLDLDNGDLMKNTKDFPSLIECLSDWGFECLRASGRRNLILNWAGGFFKGYRGLVLIETDHEWGCGLSCSTSAAFVSYVRVCSLGLCVRAGNLTGRVPSSSTQLPEELALWLFVGLRLAEMLQEEDKVSSEMCLCGALGIGLKLVSVFCEFAVNGGFLQVSAVSGGFLQVFAISGSFLQVSAFSGGFLQVSAVSGDFQHWFYDACCCCRKGGCLLQRTCCNEDFSPQGSVITTRQCDRHKEVLLIAIEV